VGSRAVTRRYRMGVSPATVRNVMVDLEDVGLLVQPHTSAGRVPTDLGYRVYVDRLMVREALGREEISVLRAALVTERRSVESFLERVSRALGQAAAQLGIAVAPRISQGTLARVEASPVSGNRVLVALVFSSGAVRTFLSRWEDDEVESAFSEPLNWVNRRVDGLGLVEFARMLERGIQSEMLPVEWRGVLRLLFDAAQAVLHPEEGHPVHFSGTDHIMAQPEFSSPQRLRPIMTMMERPDLLARNLETPEPREGVRVIIGRENPWQPMQYCSVVLSTYVSGSASGAVGVIGPTRMPYRKMVPLVERAADMIRRSLETL